MRVKDFWSQYECAVITHWSVIFSIKSFRSSYDSGLTKKHPNYSWVQKVSVWREENVPRVDFFLYATPDLKRMLVFISLPFHKAVCQTEWKIHVRFLLFIFFVLMIPIACELPSAFVQLIYIKRHPKTLWKAKLIMSRKCQPSKHQNVN